MTKKHQKYLSGGSEKMASTDRRQVRNDERTSDSLRMGSMSALTPLLDISSLSCLYIPTGSANRSSRTGEGVATQDGPVGRLLSAKGLNHLTAGTDAGRPTLRSGSGKNWLEFDGNDDAFAFSLPLTGVTNILLALESSDLDGAIIHSGVINGTTSPLIGVFQSGGASAPTSGLVTPQVKVNRGANLTTRGQFHSAITIGEPVIVNMTFGPLAGSANTSYAGYAAAGSQYRFSHKFFAMAALIMPTSQDIADVEDAFAVMSGANI